MRLPGEYLSSDRRLARLLARQKVNNGTTYGGLAHVLGQGFSGYLEGVDKNAFNEANSAFVRGAGAKPWVNPDTGDQTIPNMQGEMVPTGPAGGYEGGIQALGGLEGNEHAGRLARALMAERMGEQQQYRGMDYRARLAGEAAATAREQELEDYTRNRGDKQTDTQAMMDFKAEQAKLERESKEGIAGKRFAAAGKYYAVPTGKGIMLIDKGTGMAVMLGTQEDGSVVQRGNPFRPILTNEGIPTAIPDGFEIQDDINAVQEPPAMAPPEVPQGATPLQPQGSVSPLLPPGIDPQAQGDVTTARELAKSQAESSQMLPNVVSEAEYSLNLIDDLISHPGMKGVIGMPDTLAGAWTKMTGSAPAGTDEAGFMPRLKQLEGKQFLQAFQSLKGGGHITEIEGQKATQAMSRLSETGQKESEYIAAANELKAVLQRGLENARRKAGQGVSRETPSGPGEGGWSIKRID